MGWTNHKVVFQLLTPLHIGHMKLGNVQRTRHYVTGKALWGALTARLTRDCPELGGDYVAVGNRVNDELAFSYFYPAASAEVKPFPWDNVDEFAWRYLNTYASTALDYGRNSAEEGSLHEIEFIAPRTRDGTAVNLVGYIFAREGCELTWREMLPRLQLGGERTYGWGRVSVIHCEETTTFWDGWIIELKHDRPRLRAQNDQLPLYAHTIANGFCQVLGRIEPLVGRETCEANAHGKTPISAGACWTPGSVVSETRLQIGAYGIWQLAKGDA